MLQTDNFHLKIIVKQGLHLKDEGEISGQEVVMQTWMEAKRMALRSAFGTPFV